MLSANLASVDDAVRKEIELLKSEIASIKANPGENKNVTDKSKTAVFGGFRSLGDFEEAKTWIGNKLWDEWLPQPTEIYHRGQFNGLVFCKFDSIDDRDKVVDGVRRLSIKIQSDPVW